MRKIIYADSVFECLVEEGQEHASKYGFRLGDTIKFSPSQVAEIIEKMPTVERKTGKWIDRGGYLECSRCGGLAPSMEFAEGTLWKESSFCPDCGADMRGVEDETV